MKDHPLRALGLCRALGLWLAALGGCSADLPRQAEQSPGVLLLAPPPGTGKRQRPPVRFDHDLHTETLKGQGCEACHPRKPGDPFVPWLKKPGELVSVEERMDFYHPTCQGCHEKRASEGLKSGPVDCGECHLGRAFGVSLRQPVWFDYSLHHRHRVAAEDHCEKCHHVREPSTRKIVYQKGAEGACLDCHRDQAQDETRSLRDAVHTACVACHLDRAAAEPDKPIGPTTCKGCHGKAEQAAVKKAPSIQRLKREGQPDVRWIQAKGGTSRLVAFDHQAHEPRVSFCADCHHDTVQACSKCHTLTGIQAGGFVTLDQAFHRAGSTLSCVGCHAQTARDTAACAGCHSMLPEPPGQVACRVCHRGPTPAELAELPEAARVPPADFLAPPPPLSATALLAPVKEKPVLGLLARTYQPAELPHRKIVLKLFEQTAGKKLSERFHLEPEVLCAGCHHRSPVAPNPPGCAACHSKEAHPDLDRPPLQAAYHRQCLGCHQSMKLKTGCLDCHLEAGGTR